jgi:NADH dehydrogenase (ubiquinone) 1 alpha subcomplex subunit 4
MGPIQQFFRQSAGKPEIYPLVAILCVALTGAGYMGLHQFNSPDVVWNHKTNAAPWQHVNEGDQVKLAAFNQKYERRYNRKEW